MRTAAVINGKWTESTIGVLFFLTNFRVGMSSSKGVIAIQKLQKNPLLSHWAFGRRLFTGKPLFFWVIFLELFQESENSCKQSCLRKWTWWVAFFAALSSPLLPAQTHYPLSLPPPWLLLLWHFGIDNEQLCLCLRVSLLSRIINESEERR